jgi:predicted Zn-dependent protease
MGWYEFDDEGVSARPVLVVEDGVMKNFLMSRSPVRGLDHSNGHGRRQAGREVVSRQSNLIVESQKKVTETELRGLLINEIQRQN